MINIQNVSKSYAMKSTAFLSTTSEQVLANKEISFQCRTGEIHGLLGINGAGKSTILKMLCGLIKPDSGSIEVDGIDVITSPQQAQRNMGIFLDSDGLYPKLSARENIALYGQFHQLDDVDSATEQVIDDLHMRAIADRRTEGFSTGQRMKVALARALIHRPKYVVLDEPTRGLDVLSIRILREYLLTLKARGCCVLFSSHVMEEVEKITDRLTIINNGQVCFQGNTEALKAHSSSTDFEHAFVKVVGA